MKKTHWSSVGWVAFIGLIAQSGCAHSQVQRRIDEKLALEPATELKEKRQTEARRVIETTPGLTEAQRASLEAINREVSDALNENREKSLRLRSLLIHEVVSTSYDAEEVQAVKKRIEELSQKRLALIFDAVDRANAILGRKATEHSVILREMTEPLAGWGMTQN